MSLLIVNVQKEQQLTALKKLLEIYFVLESCQYCEADITLLAHYCLFGVSKAARKRMIRDYYPKRSLRSAEHAVDMIRSKLKKLGMLNRDPYTYIVTVSPTVARLVEDPTRFGAMIKLSYTTPEPALHEDLVSDPATA